MARESFRERPHTVIRRNDKKMEDAWISRMLETAPFGHLSAVIDGDPVIHSNLFWHDGDARIYMHSARVGKLRALLEESEGAPTHKACFTVAEVGRILPAGTPFDFSVEYASVICYGSVTVATDFAERKQALEGLMAKYAPHLTADVDYAPMPDVDIRQTSVYRIEIAERVGKHNVKPADYPAYPIPNPSFIDAEREAGKLTIGAKDLA